MTAPEQQNKLQPVPTLKETLVAAYKFLEQGRCVEAYARNAEGYAVEVSSKEAVCFCSVGALKAALQLNSLEDSDELKLATAHLKKHCGEFECIVRANDFLQYEEVKAIWQKAIASC